MTLRIGHCCVSVGRQTFRLQDRNIGDISYPASCIGLA
jgi:hypothetical protein